MSGHRWMVKGLKIAAAAAAAVLIMSGMGKLFPGTFGPIEAHAETYDFSGTVEEGSTDTLLLLKTSGGTMKIKLDSDTDYSTGKLLLDKLIIVRCVYGSDAYYHAAQLFASTSIPAPNTTVDGDRTAVSGTIGKGSSDAVMNFETSGGTMKIKIDTTTNLSGVSCLYPGKQVTMIIARGQDAYMHAVSISNPYTPAPASSAAAPASSGGITTGTFVSSSGSSAGKEVYTISGKIDDETTASIICLDTSGGMMKFKLDGDTDLTYGRALVTGRTIAVNWYRGDDAYNHISKVYSPTSEDRGGAPSLDSSTLVKVTGNVDSRTNDGMLYLNTSGGVMMLKIDTSTVYGTCRYMVEGMALEVTIGRTPGDGYWHAININLKSSSAPAAPSQSSSGNNSGYMVNGRIDDETTESIICVETSGGLMKFKVDSDTDLTNCRALVTGRAVAINWYRGNDAYNHISKAFGATSEDRGKEVSIDSSTLTRVTGKVDNRTNDAMLYLSTSGGVMVLKIDQSTTYGSCRYMVENMELDVTIGRVAGDGYWHAVTINRKGAAASQTAAPASSSGAATTSAIVTTADGSLLVQGIVDSGTTDSLLYLKTGSGTMQIKLDENTNLTICKALLPGYAVGVACKRQDDAYYHATAVVGTVQPGSAKVGSEEVTVTGTVDAKTTGNLLYLNTSGGQMQIKLDNTTAMGTCRVLTLNRTVSVAIGRAEGDGYYHALRINAAQ